jgi:trigger factor
MTISVVGMSKKMKRRQQMVKNVLVTRLEPTKVNLHFEVDAAEFDKLGDTVYDMAKGQLPAFKGFRKGKAPRHIAEKQMSPELKEQFYNSIVESAINKEYVPMIEAHRIKPLVAPQNVVPTQSGKGKDLIMDIVITVRPEIELKRYKGIEIVKTKTAVDEAEIDNMVAAEAKKNATLITITDRPSRETDIVTANFRGLLDGIPFEGGTAEGSQIEIGSKKYIPGFEEQLTGWVVGQKGSINIKIPDPYGAPQLAGKDVVFEVEVTGIQEQQFPTIDDEFAQDVGFDTLEALRTSFREKLQEQLSQQDKDINIDKILDIILEESGSDIAGPGEFFNQVIQQLIRNGQRETLPETVNANIRKAFILDAIAEVEDIKVKPEDILEYYQSIEKRYNVPVEAITAQVNKQMETQAIELLTEKATRDFLLENCVEKPE